jgi:Transaldolase/Fructose-6-phosphate aldolase
VTSPDDVVVLLDCDNALLDNDLVQGDLRDHVAREFGVESRDRYGAILEQVRAELGYVDYLGALQRYRLDALAAPDTINTIPEKTLHAFADHGEVKSALPVDGGDAEDVIAEFAQHGVDEAMLAGRLQREGAESFDKSWRDVLQCIATTSAKLEQDGRAGAGRA